MITDDKIVIANNGPMRLVRASTMKQQACSKG